MSTEGLMISCMIDATEGWDVTNNYIPGDFLQDYYYKGDIHINKEEARLNLLEEIYPVKYKDFIYIDSCKKCIYAESNKAIYSTLEASLLFWTKLSKSLEEMGYQRK